MRGAVLAGGAALRYDGRPKGLLEVGGRRILDRVADLLREVTGTPPLLVASAPEAPSWRPDLPTITDRRPGAGSLGGIYSALAGGRAEPVLCIAWDMPFLTAPLLTALLDGAPQVDVFLPESEGPRGIEPLCAVYSPACIPAIEAQMAAGDLRAVGFHERVKVGTLSLARVRAFGDPALLFFNVNTPDDLARAEDAWQRRS